MPGAFSVRGGAYMSMQEKMEQLGRKVLGGEVISRSEVELLCRVESEWLDDLFYWSNRIRQQYCGKKISFCSILSGKLGGCSEDCAFCSQSRYFKTHVNPLRRSIDEMSIAVDEAVSNGAVRIGIVNSGRCPSDVDLDQIEPLVRRVSSEGRIGMCVSLGELTDTQVTRLKSMGVTRVNHNLETSRGHFSNIISTHGYDDRIRTIQVLKQAGMSICCGGIFGIGESWQDRLDMAFELKALDVDVVPLNFLHGVEGTPVYGRCKPLQPLEALQIIAVFRFVLPGKTLKVAGGREKVLRDMQSWMFYAGANSFLIGNYLTTLGRTPEDDVQMLADLGLDYDSYAEMDQSVSVCAAK